MADQHYPDTYHHHLGQQRPGRTLLEMGFGRSRSWDDGKERFSGSYSRSPSPQQQHLPGRLSRLGGLKNLDKNDVKLTEPEMQDLTMLNQALRGRRLQALSQSCAIRSPVPGGRWVEVESYEVLGVVDPHDAGWTRRELCGRVQYQNPDSGVWYQKTLTTNTKRIRVALPANGQETGVYEEEKDAEFYDGYDSDSRPGCSIL